MNAERSDSLEQVGADVPHVIALLVAREQEQTGQVSPFAADAIEAASQPHSQER